MTLAWLQKTPEPDRFILNPTHQMPGLNTEKGGEEKVPYEQQMAATATGVTGTKGVGEAGFGEGGG